MRSLMSGELVNGHECLTAICFVEVDMDCLLNDVYLTIIFIF